MATKNTARKQDLEMATVQAEKNHFADLAQAFQEIGACADDLHRFAQSNILEALGKSLVYLIGSNRAKREELATEVLAFAQKNHTMSWDDTGVFTGTQPEAQPTDIHGHTIKEIIDLMTDGQKAFYMDLLLTEDRLWQMYNTAESSWQGINSSQERMVQPWPDQRMRGLVTLDDLIEDQKAKTLAAIIRKKQEEQAKKSQKQGQVIDFYAEMEARLKANGK